MLALLGVTLGPSAVAADTSSWTGYAGGMYGTGIGYWQGNFKAGAGDGKGEIAWCALDQAQTGPNHASSSITWGDVKYASTWTPKGGDALSQTTTARVAYVIAKWGKTSSDSRAKAIYYVTHDKTGLNGRSFNLTQTEIDLGEEMWAEAVKYAGPYTSQLDLVRATVPNRTGVAEGEVGSKTATITYSVKSRAGYLMSGYEQVLKISGPGRWTEGAGTLSADKKTLTIDSATSERTRSIVATGHGTVSVSMSTTVYDDRVVYRAPSNSTYQRLWLAGQTRAIPDSASFPATAPWDYSITTTALNTTSGAAASSSSAVAAKAGDLVGDRLTVKVDGDWPTGYEVPVTSYLYGPLSSTPTTSASVPSGTPVVGSVTTKISGAGTYATPTITIPRSGIYVWRETAPATDYVPAWAGQYGLTAESALAPWNPALTTTVSATTAGPGTVVRDTVTVAGHRPGQAFSGTARLYYAGTTKPTSQASVPSSAVLMTTQAFTGTANASGTATVTSGSYTLPSNAPIGYYTWVAALPAIAGVSTAYTAPFGETSETFVNPWTPDLGTTATPGTAAPGDLVRDTIRVYGHKPGQAITATAKLYYAGIDPPARQATVPSTAVLMTTQTASGTVGGDGTTTLTTPGYTLPSNAPRGYYVWVASLPAIAGVSTAYTHDYGWNSELLVVPWTPTVTTAASAQEASRGQQVRDSISVTGYRPGTSATLQASLYYAGPDRPAEQTKVPTGGRLLAQYNVTLTANASGAATGVTPWYTLPANTDVGFYTWVVFLQQTATSPAYSSGYGIPAETFRVRDAQLIATTQTSDAIAEPSGSLRDTVRIATTSDLSVYPAVVTSTLWGPFAQAPVLQDAAPEGAPIVAEFTSTRTSDEPYDTPAAQLPDEPGFYVWTLHVEGTADYVAYDSQFGEATEVTLVPWEPKVATQTSDARAMSGDAISDELRVWDARPGVPLTVSSTLVGPLDAFPAYGGQPPANAPVVTTLATTVTPNAAGEATATTASVVVPTSGIYVWYETIAAAVDRSSKAWAGQFGEASETTVVPWQPVVATQTSDAIGERGHLLYDELEVSDLQPGMTVDVDSTLYGPFDQPPALDADVPAGAPVVGTVTTSVTANSSGRVTATTEGIELPASGFYVWHETIAATQTTQEWSAPFGQASETTLVPWQPQFTTLTSDAIADPETTLHDRLTLTGGRPGVAIPVTSTLYGPFMTKPELSDEVPVGAPVAGAVTTVVTPDADGTATVDTDGILVDARGYYVWHETSPASEDGTVLAWSAPFGQASETTLVPWQPQVTTQTSETIAQPGTELSDLLEVTDLPPGATVDVVSTLYGPFPYLPTLRFPDTVNLIANPYTQVIGAGMTAVHGYVDHAPDGAPVAGRVTTTVTAGADGTAQATTETALITESGYYVWHETIAASDDDAIRGWAAPFGQASEITLVPWSPRVVTQTSEAVAEPGTPLTDDLQVSGLQPWSSATVVSTLFGPVTSVPQLSAEPPAGAPVAGTVTTTVVAGEDGTAEAVTLPIVVTDAGYYVWREVIDAAEDGTHTGWVAPYGQASETTLVQWSPAVVTRASTDRAGVGTDLFDTLTVSANPAGVQLEVASTLYGPFDRQPTESAAVPDGAPVVGTVTTVVDGPGEYRTPTLRVDERGYYVWHETIAATAVTKAWTGRFGLAAETTLVPWSPQVTTQTSDAIAEAGAQLTDLLQVTGMQPFSTVVVVSTLHGPVMAAPQLSDEPPADTPTVGTVTTVLVADEHGNAEAVTDPLTVEDPGHYVWRETIAAAQDGTHTGWVAPYGQASETTLVQWSPAVVTRASTARAGVGTDLFDNLTVSANPTGVQLEVHSTLYGPFAAAPVESAEVPEDAPVAGTVTTLVDGPGEYRTTPIRVDERGYYVWHETIAATDVTKAWAGRFGVAAETTLVEGAGVTTVATTQAGPGERVEDTAKVTGLTKPGAYLVFRAYGPLKADQAPSCTSETLNWTSPRVDVAGAGAYRSGQHTVTDAGVYYWVETLYDATGEATHVGACGADREVTRVHGLPVTGSNPLPLLGIAVLALLVGVVAVAWRRRDEGPVGSR